MFTTWYSVVPCDSLVGNWCNYVQWKKTDRCVTGTYLFYCLVLHLIYKFNFHSVAYSCATSRNDLWRNIADMPWKDYSAWNKTKSFSIATWSITVNIRKHCVYFRPSDRVQEKKWKLCGKKCRLCGELCGIAQSCGKANIQSPVF